MFILSMIFMHIYIYIIKTYILIHEPLLTILKQRNKCFHNNLASFHLKSDTNTSILKSIKRSDTETFEKITFDIV